MGNHNMCGSESTCCFRSLDYHISKGRRTCRRRHIYAPFISIVDDGGRLCYLVQDNIIIEKLIYEGYV